jgi:hypothetical protein
MTAQLTKEEILQSIYTEQLMLDVLQKDYIARYTMMDTNAHILRQQNINLSMRRLERLNDELKEYYSESPEVGQMVENLIFETNQSIYK